MASKAHTDDTPLIVDGLRVPRKCHVEYFRSGLQYKAQSDDIFIVTYPQSGIHWMTMIIYELLNNGVNPAYAIAHYATAIQFLERDARNIIRGTMTHPQAIQTHYPFNHVPYNPKAKYICVIRHPKDVCISIYRSLTEDPSIQSSIDFQTFFQLFIEGKTDYNDYFEHLRSIWSHKDDSNVLLVSYEQMKKDLGNVISRVAQFLHMNLNEKKELLDIVEKNASYDCVARCFFGIMATILEVYEVGLSERSSNPMQTKNDPSVYMNNEQTQLLDIITAEKTRDMPGLMAFWQP